MLWLSRIWLIIPGFILGAYGTLIGAGGGFLLVPLLLVLYPHDPPATITSISLAVVCVNATSGTMAYARLRRVDVRSGLLFTLAAVPGAVAGALVTRLLPRGPFDMLFGFITLGVAVYIFFRPNESSQSTRFPITSHRQLITLNGEQYQYAFNRWIGIGLSAGVGFLSSLLGIGGGIIHVPAMIQLLSFPAHIATATSHFVLAFTAFAGTAVHIVSGDFTHGVRRAVMLAIGVAIGAQLGARLSDRVRPRVLIQALSLGLGLVGIRLLGGGILTVLHR